MLEKKNLFLVQVQMQHKKQFSYSQLHLNSESDYVHFFVPLSVAVEELLRSFETCNSIEPAKPATSENCVMSSAIKIFIEL